MKAATNWSQRYVEYPVIAAELGGLNGKEFASAFLFHFINDLGLKGSGEHYEKITFLGLQKDDMVVYFRQILRESEKVDYGITNLLLQSCRQVEMRSQMIAFASNDLVSLQFIPLVYFWVCDHVYGMQSDQQRGEGIFNKIDLFCHSNMTQETLNSTLFMREGRHERFDDVKQVPKSEHRPKGYCAMESIMKRAAEISTVPAITATRKPCKKGPLVCKCCKKCPVCFLNFFTTWGHEKHIRTKHSIDISSSFSSCREIVCVCETEDDEITQLIECSGCRLWYHASCLDKFFQLNVLDEELLEFEEFFCPRCVNISEIILPTLDFDWDFDWCAKLPKKICCTITCSGKNAVLCSV